MVAVNGETIKRAISEQRAVFLDTANHIKRKLLAHPHFSKWCAVKEIIILTGVRRGGKSFLLRLIWKKIQADHNIAANNFLYVNFEDEKLARFTASDFDSLLEAYYELFPVNPKQKIYLFFDEIQNIPDWEKFLNRLEETNRFKIFVSGSNATLLSKEISTALTGRNFPIQVYPLSFKELVDYRLNKNTDNINAYQTEGRARLKKLFKEFQATGGFPEVVINNFRPLTQEYLKNIIYRDIVLRRRIKSEVNLREIVSFVVSNIGAPLSLENIARLTRIKNIMTVKNYLGYLEDAFLFFSVPKHSYSLKQQIYNPDKLYTIDTGLYNEIAAINSPNEGRLLENIVFLQLQRQEKQAFYFHEKNECDFVIQEKNEVTSAIQVTANLTTNNREREINGLLAAAKKYHLKQGLIITLDQTETTETAGIKIIVMPIWRWLLGI